MEITKNQKATSADKKSIGFDYQFLYFIYKALELKPKEKIGYEVKDDVHLELDNGKEIYIQLKHSLQTNSDMSIINMTEKDSDLWKSLYNWNLNINEVGQEMKSEYINSTEFILVTNKSNKDNKFFEKTENFRSGKYTVEEYKSYVLKLHDSIESDKNYSNKMKKYMKVIIDQEDDILKLFVSKLNFTFGFDDLIEKVKGQILSKHIDKRKLDEIFERCIGILSIWKYENIKKCERVLISFEDIDERITPCFQYGRNNKFPRNLKYDINLPNKLEEQNFMKEIIEINYFDEVKSKEIIRMTMFKLKLENLLDSWIQENYLTETDKENFLNECILVWTNYHQKSHRASKKAIKKHNTGDESELIELLYDNALTCLDDIRVMLLKLCDENLNIEESNGTFYFLSEQSKIGWKLEWEERY